MKSPRVRKPLFERLKTGLEEAIRHAKGEITLKTATLEMPDRPPEVGAESPSMGRTRRMTSRRTTKSFIGSSSSFSKDQARRAREA